MIKYVCHILQQKDKTDSALAEELNLSVSQVQGKQITTVSTK